MAPQGGAFIAMIQVLDIICYIDLYIMLHVATYGSKNQLIYHPYLTAKHYLTVRNFFSNQQYLRAILLTK